MERWAGTTNFSHFIGKVFVKPNVAPLLTDHYPTVTLKGSDNPIVPCVSEGDTREEALSAIELYLEPVEDDISAMANAETVEITL